MLAVVFLAAALICSLVGRILLVGAAFGVSTGWGMTVLFVPFGPLFFRLNYRELAYPTRYWRMATGPLMMLFFVNGGTADTMRSLTSFGKPELAQASMNGESTGFHLPVPSKLIAAAFGHADTSSQNPAPAPAATPSVAVASAVAAMPAAPKVISPAERQEANRQEFERLAEWYDNLKRERGYLRKSDVAGIEAYNVEAAKYEAALQLAKNEQAELSKLTATK